MKPDWRDLEVSQDRTDEIFLLLAVAAGLAAVLLHCLLR
jgi:hypothetical protein